MLFLFRAVVNPITMKPITEVPDASDLKNGSNKTYAEAMKELALHQQLSKPRSESSKLQPALQLNLLDNEASVPFYV